MRRIMLLTLLALASPTVALATSQAFTATTGPLNFTLSSSTTNHFASGISNLHPWILNLVGTIDTITLRISSLGMGCNVQNGSCTFSGIVRASGPGVPGTFSDSVSGTMHRGPNMPGTGGPVRFLASLTGALAGVPPGSNLTIANISICASGGGICAGLSNGRLLAPNGSGTLNVVPEPGTLGLLGTGLFGLAGLVRRKRKLGP